jgi:glycosyltransferase involved in cell wall biosynthesis
LIENAVNRGPSGSRNTGFKAAIGEWLAIHDADDTWRENRLEKMLDAAAQYDANIVTDNMLLYDLGSDVVTRTGFSTDHGVRWIKPIDVFEQDVQLGAEFGYGLLQPMMKRSFLEENKLAYIEDVRYGEDLIFLSEMMFSGAKAIIIPDPLYVYTTRIGELSGQYSPHSKSVPRFDLISDGIDGLKLKYPQAITPDIDRAMTRLARRYRLVHRANLAKDVRLKKGLPAYALFVVQRPSVIVYVLRAWLRRWRSRAKLKPSALPEES